MEDLPNVSEEMEVLIVSPMVLQESIVASEMPLPLLVNYAL